MSGFKIAVTITEKKHPTFPLWNKTHLQLEGDKADMSNLQKQLELVKKDINRDMNKRGLALSDVTVEIEFLADKQPQLLAEATLEQLRDEMDKRKTNPDRPRVKAEPKLDELTKHCESVIDHVELTGVYPVGWKHETTKLAIRALYGAQLEGYLNKIETNEFEQD